MWGLTLFFQNTIFQSNCRLTVKQNWVLLREIHLERFEQLCFCAMQAFTAQQYSAPVDRTTRRNVSTAHDQAAPAHKLTEPAVDRVRRQCALTLRLTPSTMRTLTPARARN
jgi:hypothetical protein